MKRLWIVINLFTMSLYGMHPVVATLVKDYQSLRKDYLT